MYRFHKLRIILVCTCWAAFMIYKPIYSQQSTKAIVSWMIGATLLAALLVWLTERNQRFRDREK